MKKYEFTEEAVGFMGTTLHRIRAVRDFENNVAKIKAGDLGGWIEKEENLSHDGNAWVGDNACVWGNAVIFGNAVVCNNGGVSGNACVGGNALVCDDGYVRGNAHISDNAIIGEKALVDHCATVCGNAWVGGEAKVFDYAVVYENARIYDNARICANAQLEGRCCVYGNATIFNARIYGDAKIYGEAVIDGKAVIGHWANICKNTDYMVIFPIGTCCSTGETFGITFYKCQNGECRIAHRYGNVDLDGFIKKRVEKNCNDNNRAKQYMAAIELAKIRFEKE